MSFETYYKSATPEPDFNTARGVEILDDGQTVEELLIQSGNDDDGFFISVGWDGGPDSRSVGDSVEKAANLFADYYNSLDSLYVEFGTVSSGTDDTICFDSQEAADILNSDNPQIKARDIADRQDLILGIVGEPSGYMDDLIWSYRSDSRDGYALHERTQFGRDEAEFIAGTQYDSTPSGYVDALEEALRKKT